VTGDQQNALVTTYSIHIFVDVSLFYVLLFPAHLVYIYNHFSVISDVICDHG